MLPFCGYCGRLDGADWLARRGSVARSCGLMRGRRVFLGGLRARTPVNTQGMSRTDETPVAEPAPAGPEAWLWLVRHAESVGNLADRRAQEAGAEQLELTHRDPDVPLSETGRRQARALGRAWRSVAADERPTRVLCSPYERASQTARTALAAAGWDVDVTRDERLRERDLGLLDGYTKHGIEARFPEEAQRRARLGKFYYRPPGGESWADVAGRVRAVLTDIKQSYDGERLLLVTHQAVIMLYRYVLEGLTEQQILEIDSTEIIANTAVTTYRWTRDGAQLLVFNDTRHLEHQREPVTEEPDATNAVAR
jgi:broad specificity phosphatase PhoE